MRVPEPSDTSAKRQTQVQHECDTSNASATRVRTSETRMTQVQHEGNTSDTSATRAIRLRHERKMLILIKIRVKTIFYILILAMLQMKDYNRGRILF